jgi:two-component system, sensor histidine kinase PdtaS
MLIAFKKQRVLCRCESVPVNAQDGALVFSSASGTFSEHSREVNQNPLPWGPSTAVVVIATGTLILDAVTPPIISVGILYVGLTLLGFWFPNPKAAFALALLATILIIVRFWLTIPDNTPIWEAWLNRAIAIGTVWLVAAFVWHIRTLDQKLQVQIEIVNNLSRETEHRIGNHLQLVASFLRLQAKSSHNEECRRALELAGSRVMVIGNIQRSLSHLTPEHMVDAKAFIAALIREVHSAFPDPDTISVTVRADPAELTSTTAMALGAVLLELMNNSLKHAFHEGTKGMLAVSFTAANNQYILEFEDDGVGIDQNQTRDGFGTQNVTDFARLMGGSITCIPARQSNTRPGTLWRLIIPA